jgi:hypothetical protein
MVEAAEVHEADLGPLSKQYPEPFRFAGVRIGN